MEKELMEINDDFGIELKKSFDDEFDLEDITVSEDLFARTMAAIRKEADKNTSTDTKKYFKIQGDETDSSEADSYDGNVTYINSPKKSTVIWKWASGIAAAMFIGLVIVFVVKIGKGGYKNESASSNSILADNASVSDNRGDDLESVKNSRKSDSAKTETSASQAFESPEYSQPAVSTEEYKEKAEMAEEQKSAAKQYDSGSMNIDFSAADIQSADIDATPKDEEFSFRGNTSKDLTGNGNASGGYDSGMTGTSNENYEVYYEEKSDDSKEKSDDSLITDSVTGLANDTDEDVADESDGSTGFSEEEIDKLLKDFISGVEQDGSIKFKNEEFETDYLQPEDYTGLEQQLRETELYGILSLNKEAAIKELDKLLTSCEDPAERTLIDILIKNLDKDADE